MKTILWLLAVVAIQAGWAVESIAGDIQVRLSFKAVLNPANGQRPAGMNDTLLDNIVSNMNTLLTSYGRGFRLVRTGPLIDVGWLGGYNDGPSQWYNVNFHDDDNGDAWFSQMKDDAGDDPDEYAWNDDAINLYLTAYAGATGGKSSGLIVLSTNFVNRSVSHERVLHEIGHYFSLAHTQGDGCDWCDAAKSGPCHTEPGEDYVSDTLPDLPCWDRNDIAFDSFQTTFNNLSAAQREQVNNVFYNVMSYHNDQALVRFTPDQLDRWTEAANGTRRPACSGRTWFVDWRNISVLPTGSSEVNLNPFIFFVGGAFPTIEQSLAYASSSDIVLIRPGTYEEALTLNQPATLRATRGNVVIR